MYAPAQKIVLYPLIDLGVKLASPDADTRRKQLLMVLLIDFRQISHLWFYRAILSHECATFSRDKVAEAATIKLHAATLSDKQTRLL